METVSSAVVVRMVKIDGNLRVTEMSKPVLEEWKKGISDGQVVEVEFRGPALSSSNRARKKFFTLRDLYANALGYDKGYAKDELCCMFGVAQEAEAGECPEGWHEIVIWDEGWHRKSLSNYTQREMYNLIENVLKSCHENGIDTSLIQQEFRDD